MVFLPQRAVEGDRRLEKVLLQCWFVITELKQGPCRRAGYAFYKGGLARLMSLTSGTLCAMDRDFDDLRKRLSNLGTPMVVAEYESIDRSRVCNVATFVRMKTRGR